MPSHMYDETNDTVVISWYWAKRLTWQSTKKESAKVNREDHLHVEQWKSCILHAGVLVY